jgi:hypothetical protein
MDAPSNTTECPRCRELEARVKALEQQLAEVLTLLPATQRKLAETEAKLAAATKNSSKSSKPPSSDIVKPSGDSRKRKSKRKRGAQPGQPRHSRPLFGAEQVDQVVDYHALDAGRETCPDCGGTLELLDVPAQVLQ